MEANESWWRKSVETAQPAPQPQGQKQPEPGTEDRPRREEPVDSDSEEDGANLGDQINRAIGDFDAQIMSLKEELQEKRTDVKELEIRIADLEKEQAKAFKGLLSSNPQIKKMLTPKTKRSSGRRKKTTPKPPANEGENESLL